MFLNLIYPCKINRKRIVGLGMRITLGETGWRILIAGRPGEWSCLPSLALECGYRICEICRKLGCSERYFHHVATRDIGLPPKAWMRQERMIRARHMLSEGITSDLVAEKIGYSAIGSFRREFRKFHPICPREYQTQNNPNLT